MIRNMPKVAAMLCVLAFVAACVTVNIYFPAAEVSKAADEIVEDVYGVTGEQQPQSGLAALGGMVASLFVPTEAHAQDATTVGNAAIRGLKKQIAANHKQLARYYGSGNVGITKDGMLAMRNSDGLSVQQVAGVKRLVKADNGLRANLYSEVARALKTPEVGKVQAVFADTWRGKAQKGWCVQADNGSWSRK